MRIVKDFLVLGLCISFLTRVSSIDICQLLNDEEVVMHVSYKDGNRSCCRIRVCPAGFEAVMCGSNNPNSTSCQPCPPNTFQSYPTSSVDMINCESKRSCDGAGMKVEDDGSRISNRRCLCDLEKGYCNPFRNRSTYCQRRYCPFGSQLNQDCSCSDCPDGFFKDVNGSMPCKPWRNCRAEGRRTVVEGTTTTDTVCGNSTNNNRGRVALPVTKPLMTTAALSESMSTSDFPKVHSSESHQNSSGLDHTTLQNESSHKWWIAFIVIGIFVVVVVLATAVCIFRCLNVKRICARWKPDRLPSELASAGVVVGEETPDVKVPLIHQQTDVEAPTDKGLPKLVTLLPVRGCIDEEREAHTTPETVKDPLPDRTSAMKDSLINCRVTLLQNLIIDEVFLSLLRINNTITDDMKQNIQSKPTPNSRNDQLLDYLQRRPCLSYKTFIVALIYTGQSNLARQINAELTEEYEVYVDEGLSVKDKVLSFGRL